MDEDTALQIDFSKLPDDLKNNISNVESEGDEEDIEHFSGSNVKNEIKKGKATKAQLGKIEFYG